MTDFVFRQYTQSELDRQYDQSVWAAKSRQTVIQRYRELSEMARARLGPPLEFAYGETDAELIDVYRTGQDAAPIHIYIHGGAWRSLDKRDSAFAAELFVSAGVHFIAVNFALLPKVELRTMVHQVRNSIAWAYRNAHLFGGDRERIFLSGHSSGAHLAACAAVTRWEQSFGLPGNILKGTLCCSGAYDLEPVRLSARNRYMHLDETAVHDLSPNRHLKHLGCPISFAVGELESDEFRRQSAKIATSAGVELALGSGLDHFQISETLGQPSGLLATIAIAQMSSLNRSSSVHP